MPRFPRVVVPEFCHHVTQRGNARREVFFTPQDRQVYLGLLKDYAAHYRLRILGYCLMPNHVHLVIVPGDEIGLAKALREIHGRYARYRNAIDQSSGHVWQGRYYSCAFEWVRLPSVMRYVELNPVRAGIVREAADFAWSSAITHLGGENARGLLEVAHWEKDWTPAQWARALANANDEGDTIRAATYSGRPFGSDPFVVDLEHKLARRLQPGRAGRPKKTVEVSAA